MTSFWRLSSAPTSPKCACALSPAILLLLSLTYLQCRPPIYVQSRAYNSGILLISQCEPAVTVPNREDASPRCWQGFQTDNPDGQRGEERHTAGTVFLPHEVDIADLRYILLMPGALNPHAIYNPLQPDVPREHLCTTAYSSSSCHPPSCASPFLAHRVSLRAVNLRNSKDSTSPTTILPSNRPLHTRSIVPRKMPRQRLSPSPHAFNGWV